MPRKQTPASFAPRLMKAPLAAWYLGMSETKLAELVKAGRIAQPSDEDGMVRWRIEDLDDYADNLRRRDETARVPPQLRAI